VYVCLFKREQKGGDRGRFWSRSDAISAPIGYLQSRAIVRVWHRARKSPAQRLGVSDLRVSRGLCDPIKARCATRRGNLWARQFVAEFQFNMLNCELRAKARLCAFGLAI